MSSQHASWLEAVLRRGSAGPADTRRDLLLLLSGCLILVATGMGLRDPWPADEPRFVLIARDMVASGDWLIPRVAGDLYAEKPPLFLWLVSAALRATGELRIAFLLPSLLAAIGTVWLVYDIVRRLWNRESALVAGLLLLTTVQFVWQARQAQIDAVLCFWTTLSLYGLLRHLLLGPHWRWYAIAWFAAGLGIITKGVGFLPLLILLPFALLSRRKWEPRVQFGPKAYWLLGPLALSAAVAIWLVPMLIAAEQNPALAAYRDAILFEQTITRYAQPWHHHEPFYYYFLNVIPLLWLPLSALLPWLIPVWRRSLQARDLRVGLLLAWVVLVLLFFSVTAGKRGVYVLPAVPALVIASAPALLSLLERHAVQRMLYVIALMTGILCAGAALYALLAPDLRVRVQEQYGLDVIGPLLCLAAGCALIAMARTQRGIVAYGSTIAWVLLVVSFWINPTMNESRSGEQFIRQVHAVADPKRELGFSMLKEQFMLVLQRPVFHFGHGRWQNDFQEAADAARWVSSAPNRELVVTAFDLSFCFDTAQAIPIGRAHREEWYIVRGGAHSKCMEQGNLNAARRYVPTFHDNSDLASRVATNPL